MKIGSALLMDRAITGNGVFSLKKHIATKIQQTLDARETCLLWFGIDHNY